MPKYSLINHQDLGAQEGDIIRFEMPSFVSGDYCAIVKKDPIFGLYIDSKDNYFHSCRDYSVEKAPREKTMLERIKEHGEWLDTPAGQESIREWREENDKLVAQEDRNYERFCRMVENTGLEVLMEKIEVKYNSDKYINKEHKLGFQPREELKDYILRYFEEHGETTQEGVNAFMDCNYKIGDYLVGLMIGQGSYIKIQNRNDEDFGLEICPDCLEPKQINGVSGKCDDCRPKNR